jgi:hypothetical protein
MACNAEVGGEMIFVRRVDLEAISSSAQNYFRFRPKAVARALSNPWRTGILNARMVRNDNEQRGQNID